MLLDFIQKEKLEIYSIPSETIFSLDKNNLSAYCGYTVKFNKFKYKDKIRIFEKKIYY